MGRKLKDDDRSLSSSPVPISSTPTRKPQASATVVAKKVCTDEDLPLKSSRRVKEIDEESIKIKEEEPKKSIEEPKRSKRIVALDKPESSVSTRRSREPEKETTPPTRTRNQSHSQSPKVTTSGPGRRRKKSESGSPSPKKERDESTRKTRDEICTRRTTPISRESSEPRPAVTRSVNQEERTLMNIKDCIRKLGDFRAAKQAPKDEEKSKSPSLVKSSSSSSLDQIQEPEVKVRKTRDRTNSPLSKRVKEEVKKVDQTKIKKEPASDEEEEKVSFTY